MNYKITTWVLLVILIICFGWHWNAMNSPQSQMMMGNQHSMHMMHDGKMMKNGAMDDSMNMDAMMDSMIANMKGKSGKELEKAFLTDMIPHHQGAVDMAKLLLQDKTIRPELVKFANDIITAQEGEIKQMNVWLKSY